jgi:glycerophosphoryl diester phosphodiesterase
VVIRYMTAVLVLMSAALVATPIANAAPGACPTEVAHRGFHDPLRPDIRTENGMPAFRAATYNAVERVDADLRFTRDEVPVLMHDATVNRTTNGTGAVADMSARQIGALRLDDGSRVPRLDRLLRYVAERRHRLNVEMKGMGDGDTFRKVVAKIYNHDVQGRVVVMSFERAWLNRVNRLDRRNRIRLALITGSRVYGDDIPRYVSQLHIRYTSLTSGWVDRMHARGLRVAAYTPNDREAWAAVDRAGADFAITDRVPAYRAWCWATL